MAIIRTPAIRGLEISPEKGLRVISEPKYCIRKSYELYLEWMCGKRKIGIEAIVGQTISQL